MDASSREVVEAFAGQALGKRHSATLQTEKLAKQGYDTGMLLVLVAEYMALPAAKRSFTIEKDFGTVGGAEEFGLLIRRK